MLPLPAGLWLRTAPLPQAAAEATAAGLLLPAGAERWVEARRMAFRAGRAVASRALRAAGATATVVECHASGAPQWPQGYVGSIAHDAGRAVAVVGAASRWAALGVDVEPDAPLPLDAGELVLRPEDHQALQAAFGHEAGHYGRLVFGAKECVHKALHPWRGAWLPFDAVCTRWWVDGPDAGRWRAMACSAEAALALPDAARIEGYWWRRQGALFTLLAIAAA